MRHAHEIEFKIFGGAGQRKIRVGLFGVEGFIMQRLEGDGLTFMYAEGAARRRRLDGPPLRAADPDTRRETGRSIF